MPRRSVREMPAGQRRAVMAKFSRGGIRLRIPTLRGKTVRSVDVIEDDTLSVVYD